MPPIQSRKVRNGGDAAIGDNFRPIQPLLGRCVRTNIDFSHHDEVRLSIRVDVCGHNIGRGVTLLAILPFCFFIGQQLQELHNEQIYELQTSGREAIRSRFELLFEQSAGSFLHDA